MLTHAEQQAVRETMTRAAAQIGQPRDTLGRARQGMRWADIPDAVVCACDTQAVEMAMVTVRTDQGRSFYDYTLKTIEDFPASLRIDRTDDERIYAATATAGVYGDRRDRAQALLDALHHCMRQFGAKVRFDEPAISLLRGR